MAVKKTDLYAALLESANKLRGGVEPSRYKDYVLILLFFKYVTDKYKDDKYGDLLVEEGASYDDLINLKQDKDIGENTDKIIQRFLELNNLKGSLPDVSFNNEDELGKGKELIDTVSGLIKIFDNKALNFKSNRANGDDIIGDAYEYFMKNFAQESGKSKGQFYTPSEVSRVVARLVGIGDIDPILDKKWTIFDPAAGSGSLLIRATDEAPKDEDGNTIVSIFAQEKYSDTAGLAKMNFILHNKSTGEIRTGNSLADPQWITATNELRQFDFIVMNPPFSDKDWSDGVNVDDDEFNRFLEFGTPPEKNGDYAWFLHVLKSLKPNGKAGIILPHGVLFRDLEKHIRSKIIEKKYIKGIISLPSNLFFGTGIPACIIILDKEVTDDRDSVFMIDASQGFRKDGNKNKLREQDIEKIVQYFTNQIEEEGYSRKVFYDEIVKENDYNLNIPRYIERIDNSLEQNIASHLYGGIPSEDIKSLSKLWTISPSLKNKLFKMYDQDRRVYELVVDDNKIEETIFNDNNVQEQIQIESKDLFNIWKNQFELELKNIHKYIDPKSLVREMGESILYIYSEAKLLDRFDVYDYLLNYWNETMQDDVYVLISSGYEAGTNVEVELKKSKNKKIKETTEEVDTTVAKNLKNFDGLLIPRLIIEKEYFNFILEEISDLEDQSSVYEDELSKLIEENSDDDGLLNEVLNDAGDSIPKTNLNNRIKELEGKKESEDVNIIEQLISLQNENQTQTIEDLYEKFPSLSNYDIKNKDGSFGKTKLPKALKKAQERAVLPEKYKEEYNLLKTYEEILKSKTTIDKQIKSNKLELDQLVMDKYKDLSIEEVKDLLFEKKWMVSLEEDIESAIDQETNRLASNIKEISKRYETKLSDVEEEVDNSRIAVQNALERMGYKW